MTDETFLDKAYHIDGPQGVKDLYAKWANSYESEVTRNGYATPSRIAAALSEFINNKSAPILDYGCGTGLSGLALQAQGFTNIVGADPSPEMLAFADQKNAYSELIEIDVTQPPPFEPGQFPTIAAIGVIGSGAAPIEVFDALFQLLKSGQRMALSLNDHSLAIPAFPDRISHVIDNASGKLIFEEYGPHFPAQDIKSMIYIIEKT
jgi:predicted TPR repeat methyltransferase